MIQATKLVIDILKYADGNGTERKPDSLFALCEREPVGTDSEQSGNGQSREEIKTETKEVNETTGAPALRCECSSCRVFRMKVFGVHYGHKYDGEMEMTLFAKREEAIYHAAKEAERRNMTPDCNKIAEWYDEYQNWLEVREHEVL